MEIDLDKLDLITQIEDKLEKMLYKEEQNQFIIELKNYSRQEIKLYLLTIMSILYKQKHYMIYEINKTKKIDQNITQELIESVNNMNIIEDELKKYIRQNDVIKSIMILLLNKDLIFTTLEIYFGIKNINYIMSKMQIEKSIKTQKNLLSYNPYIINQYIKYDIDKLTTEEQIIGDIIEFDRITLLKLDEIVEQIDTIEFSKRRLKLIKTQILKNYNKQKQNEIILFIISNVYQEMIENKEEKSFTNIKKIIEHKDLTNDGLVQIFINNDVFSDMVIGKFITYNQEIKKGRLEELKQKESYKTIKKRRNN